MKWTDKQQKAIRAPLGAQVVSAGAGSGKTSVMNERIMYLLNEGGCSIANFAVMTFTRAAAQELKRRITAALETSALAGDAKARRELSLLSEAYIGTIHSFCMRVVRMHHESADVDPDFTIADSATLALLKSRTALQCVEDMYDTKREDFRAFASVFNNKENTALSALIIGLTDTLMNIPDPFESLELCVEAYNKADADMLRSPFAEELRRGLLDKCTEAMERCAHLLELLELPTAPQKPRAAIESDQSLASMLYEYIDERRYCTLSPIKVPAFARYAAEKTADEELKSLVKAERDGIKALCKDIIESPLLCEPHALCERTRAMYPHMRMLLEVLQAYEARLAREKRTRGILEFADLEQKCLKVLRDTRAAQKLSAKYSYILVDEYQDVNPMQEAIMRALEQNSSFFCVGDIKQSIYSFRGAAPELFAQRTDTAPEGSHIRLSENFRSSGGIIDFINETFSALMSLSAGGVAYRNGEALTAMREATESFSVKTLLVESTAEEDCDDESEALIAELSNTQKEALALAEELKGRIGQDIYDQALGCMRPLRAGDIAVLTRSIGSGIGEIYAKALRQAGIPAYAESKTALIGESEVALVLRTLEYLDNALDDRALICVLFGAKYSFGANELAAIRALFPQDSFSEAAVKYASEKSDPTAMRLRAFLAAMKELRIKRRFVSNGAFMSMLVYDSGLYEIEGALPNGDTRQRNLRTLVNAAYGYEGSFTALTAYLRQALQSMEMQYAQSEGDAARIMTIHHSKGLEFPLVALVRMSTAFHLKDLRQDVLYTRELGVGVTYRDAQRRVKGSTLFCEAVKQAKRRSVTDEEMRLLYVALTRAKDSLLLVGCLRDAEQHARQALLLHVHPQDGKSYLAWLLPRVAQYCAQAGGAPREGISTQIIHPESLLADEPPAPSETLMPHSMPEGASQRLEALAAWRYRDADVYGLPAKVSATSLLDPSRDFRAPLSAAPQQTKSSGGFSPMELGTFMHELLRRIEPGVKTRADLQTLAEALERDCHIPLGASAALDLSVAARYLNSDIYSRICHSSQVMREQPFVLSLPVREIMPKETSTRRILVQGIIDCCFIENGQWILVDYKTNRAFGPEGKRALLEHYRPQLVIYAKALERITGIKVGGACLYLTSLGEESYIPNIYESENI